MGGVTRRRPRNRRARQQAEAAGLELTNARARHGWTREQVALRAHLAADTVRRLESGHPGAELDTLCALSDALGLDVVLRLYPSREPSLRDTGQLATAEALRGVAHPSWTSQFEVPAGDRGEAADACFFGPTEILHVEIERMLLDFQDQYRRMARKRDWLAERHRRPVRLVMVVEDRERNRAAVAPHADFVRGVLPATSRQILSALRTGRPLGRDGLLWIRRRQPPRPSR